MEKNSVAKSSKHLAADVIPVSEDVVSEIFLRLPVKCVIRSKLVSKEWQSFISRPHFGRKHTHLSLRKNPDFLSPRGLFFHHPGSQYLDYIPIPLSVTNITTSRSHFPLLSFLESAVGSLVSVIHSCNGLLLCHFASKFRFDHCICNLTTSEFTMVPQLPDHSLSMSPVLALAFNPLESPYYKIVCLCDIYHDDIRNLRRHRIEVLVYSSENSTWISRGCTEWHGSIRLMKPAAYKNRAIFWILDSECFCLDLNEEKVKLKKITPPGVQTNDYYWNRDYKEQVAYLGEWCGHLHAVYIQNDSDKDFHVLEFDQFSSEWYEKYTGNIADIISGFPSATVKETRGHGPDRIYYVFTILAMVRGDDEEDSALVLAIPSKVISYNFMLKTVEDTRAVND